MAVKQKSPEPKRLFFALWPTVAAQAQFREIAGHHSISEKDRLVAAHLLHLTLSFLGSVDAVTETCVCKMADALVWQPLELDFDRLGWFARPQVLWAGSSAVPVALDELASAIQQGVARCGIKSEMRAFKPHITLARKVTQAPDQQEIETVTCCFKQLCLVQSQPERNGVSYRNVVCWPAQLASAQQSRGGYE